MRHRSSACSFAGRQAAVSGWHPREPPVPQPLEALLPAVPNRDVEIFFEDSGAGPPLVLGHSFLCSADMWREQVPALRSQFRTVNCDLRGHGRSSHVASPFSLYDALADVIAVLDHLQIQRATWCGLSIGGMVALRAALAHPDRVAALVLLDTDAGPETGLHRLKYGAMGIGAGILGMGPFVPSIARLMFGVTTRRQNATLVEEWKGRFARAHVPSIRHCLRALLTRDSLLDRLGGITVPTLVLVGAEDRSLPPPYSQRIHQRIPGSQFGLIPGAGHLSPLEQPGLVTKAITDFISAQPH